jgi:polyhydroxybutyrate depolymerase
LLILTGWGTVIFTFISFKNCNKKKCGGFAVGLALLGQFVCFSAAFAAGSYDLKSEIDGEKRLAKVYVGKAQSGEPQPLILAFHGYGDNRIDFSRFVKLHKSWPQAIVAYPDGLKIPDAQGKLRSRGWQSSRNALGDRDLKYVDFLLKELADRYKVDKRKIYATGFSNGARFVFLLMGERTQAFAAFAPVGSAARQQELERMTTAKPVIYIIGREEGRRTIEAAQNTVEVISKLNRSSKEQSQWADNYVLFLPAKGGADFIFNLHKSGHVWPYDASDLIVRFFHQNPMN